MYVLKTGDQFLGAAKELVGPTAFDKMLRWESIGDVPKLPNTEPVRMQDLPGFWEHRYPAYRQIMAITYHADVVKPFQDIAHRIVTEWGAGMGPKVEDILLDLMGLIIRVVNLTDARKEIEALCQD